MATQPHILSTEDDPSIQGLLADLLDGEGYRVTFAAPQDAAGVAALAPDLMLLDYWTFGTVTAGELLEQVKAEPTTAAIPVILLTEARRDVDEHDEHLAAVGATVVLKPFDIDVLLGKVRECVGGGRRDSADD